MAGNLKNNLESILNQLQLVKTEHKELSEPTVIAVSKKQPIEKIKEMYSLGIKDFGENYVQESLEKKSALNDLGIFWHYIGAIQSKKLKDIVGQFHLIHSVSREVELQKISQIAQEKNITQKILVQLNIAKEETKSGVFPKDFSSFCQAANQQKGIQLCGMMVFPPLEDSDEKSRVWFEQSKEIFDQVASELKSDSWTILSMGTSSDFPQAYDCGATHLRIGESLMGPRPK